MLNITLGFAHRVAQLHDSSMIANCPQSDSCIHSEALRFQLPPIRLALHPSKTGDYRVLLWALDALHYPYNIPFLLDNRVYKVSPQNPSEHLIRCLLYSVVYFGKRKRISLSRYPHKALQNSLEFCNIQYFTSINEV